MLRSVQNKDYGEVIDIVIVDFGSAHMFDPKRPQTALRTGGITSRVDWAPESIDDEKFDARKYDIWQFGLVMHSVLYGEHMFDDARDEIDVYRMMAKGFEGADLMKKLHGVPGVFGESVANKNLVDLLGKMLQKDPEERLSIFEVLVGFHTSPSLSFDFFSDGVVSSATLLLIRLMFCTFSGTSVVL